MNVTSVRVRKPEENANKVLLGYADIVIDNAIAIHEIKIINNGSKTFVSFPSKKKVENGEVKHYDLVHPLNSDTRNIIEEAVLNEYNKII